MSHRIKQILPRLLLGVVLTLAISGCSQVVTDSNWTLASGETLRGDVILPSANAMIDENAHVAGSVVMLCCNLIINGKVDGDVLVMSGNMELGPHAIVGGNVTFITGNEDGKPGNVVQGRTWHLGQ